MKHTKIILTMLVSLGVLFAFNAFAAARLSVPKNDPLQPIPADTAPNVSNNINTSNSDINQNLQSQLPSDQSSEQPVDPTPTPAPANPDQTAPIVGDVPTTSTTFYWVILFIGLGGLMCLGLWSYFRFLRKQ